MTKTTPQSKPDCIFCQIASHQLNSNIVFEDDHFIAFYDIHPVSKGHTLVIPKQHISDFYAFTQQSATTIKHYLDFIRQVMEKLKQEYKPKGIRVSFNTDGLIEVAHLHAHLIPVY